MWHGIVLLVNMVKLSKTCFDTFSFQVPSSRSHAASTVIFDNGVDTWDGAHYPQLSTTCCDSRTQRCGAINAWPMVEDHGNVTSKRKKQTQPRNNLSTPIQFAFLWNCKTMHLRIHVNILLLLLLTLKRSSYQTWDSSDHSVSAKKAAPQTCPSS